MKAYLLTAEGVAFRFISSLANYTGEEYHSLRRKLKKGSADTSRGKVEVIQIKDQ